MGSGRAGLDAGGQGWSIGSHRSLGPARMTAALPRMTCLFVLALGALAFVDSASAQTGTRQTSFILMEKGNAAAARGDASGAQRLLEEAVVADPANARALCALGRLHDRQGRKALARKYYNIALGIDPVEADALNWAGQLDIAEGKMDDARDKLRKLGVTCPACPQRSELASAFGKTIINQKPSADGQ